MYWIVKEDPVFYLPYLATGAPVQSSETKDNSPVAINMGRTLYGSPNLWLVRPDIKKRTFSLKFFLMF